jgi:SpoVK/Ycf46/Vps4 family AAA+-type ATPase
LPVCLNPCILMVAHPMTCETNSTPQVFLRILEYYEGILFLTTNRVDSFDLAFKSRIHLAIKYPKLGQSSRRKLWRTFLSYTSQTSLEALAADGTLDELAEEDLNGRQIKNIVRTAHTLALSENAPIRKDHIISAIEPMKLFELELEKAATEKRKRDMLHDKELTVSAAKRPRKGGDVTSFS